LIYEKLDLAINVKLIVNINLKKTFDLA